MYILGSYVSLQPYSRYDSRKGVIDFYVSQETLKKKTSCQCTTAHCDDLDICVEVVYSRSIATTAKDVVLDKHAPVSNSQKMTIYAQYEKRYISKYSRYRYCRARFCGYIGPYQVSSDVTGGKWKSSYVGIPLKCNNLKVCLVNFILSLQLTYKSVLKISDYESLSPQFRSPTRCYCSTQYYLLQDVTTKFFLCFHVRLSEVECKWIPWMCAIAF